MHEKVHEDTIAAVGYWLSLNTNHSIGGLLCSVFRFALEQCFAGIDVRRFALLGKSNLRARTFPISQLLSP